MKTIRLRINDKAYEKFLSLLNKFSKEEIEIIAEDDEFLATQKYLQKELSEIDNGTANFVSEEILEDRLNKKITSETKEDWWTKMSKAEQEEIKIGLKQADKGEFIAHEKVMKRFAKWH
jgi:tyrosyl-tRNA synthetase